MDLLFLVFCHFNNVVPLMLTRCRKQNSKMTPMTFYQRFSSLGYVTLCGKRDFTDVRITEHFTLK